MKVGSLVRNKSFTKSMGIVLKVYKEHDDVLIHWVKSGKVTVWSRYSHNLEVICE